MIMTKKNKQLPMKKILLTTLFLLFANSIFSQTSIYPKEEGTKIFNENGYTYQADRLGSGIIKVYNSDNKWINQTKIHKHTGDFPDENTPDLESNEWKKQTDVLYSILEESYSDEEKEKIKGIGRKGTGFVELFINPETGKVDDVRFSFFRLSYYMYIPVSKFREIELKIKEKLQFKVTDYGKELNYIYDFHNYNFE